MNRLRCLFSGGHRYSPSKIITHRNAINCTIVLRNFCIKCGKMISFEMPDNFIDEEIKREAKKIYNKGFGDALKFGYEREANDGT